MPKNAGCAGARAREQEGWSREKMVDWYGWKKHSKWKYVQVLTQVKSFVLFLALFNDLGRFRVAFCINKTYLRCKNVGEVLPNGKCCRRKKKQSFPFVFLIVLYFKRLTIINTKKVIQNIQLINNCCIFADELQLFERITHKYIYFKNL
jgi:hypothetical protein